MRIVTVYNQYFASHICIVMQTSKHMNLEMWQFSTNVAHHVSEFLNLSF